MFVEKRSIQYSAAAHIGVFLIAFFGFPNIFNRPDPEPFVMTVEVVPIGTITNLPSRDKPLSKWQQAPTPPTPKKVVPVQKEKTEIKKPDLPKDAVPLPEPDKKVEKKEEPKKEDVKEDTKKEEEDFDAILKSLQQQADEEVKKPNKKDKETSEENKTKSDKPYDPTMPLSISEKDAIRSQFVKCWRMPAGAMDADKLVVRVRVQVSQAGEVTEAKLASGQEGPYRSNTFFRAAADSAIRAVWKCSPLENLPAEKYETWSDMELTFDPSEMLY